ncbi:MAG: bifunctional phosphoribosylaminoimidazolecarboxamide formyltransferase/IMP cyclohydrolase [Prevotellaceae bacterium]|jgi:phosphoribosylaminoimidazolecarboxamide formyltransferase/IMP cyclohydrolase|nr:bifunctional phosphoribosylaminoimidazolecarboxamide formyltransferase/IMP cyclohydrolase [Prevotellaceae bacterium]
MSHTEVKKINSALISVYHKDKLDAVVRLLDELGVAIYSTGGTLDFINGLGVKAQPVEDLTGYPPILGGRVKTLHPKVFGGILARRDNAQDAAQLSAYNIPPIDLVIVDLYPFADTLRSGADAQAIIEKIDIGGISLIRAAAKNFADTLVISSRGQYPALIELLQTGKGATTLDIRRTFAAQAFQQSSYYDTAIFNYFNAREKSPVFQQFLTDSVPLRYGENPHQQARFYGRLDELLEQLHGKEISYNNLLDIDAAVALIGDFPETTFVVLKHNNACGCASNAHPLTAWRKALAGDPVSAFGGVIITNRPVDAAVAKEINELFFEVIIAPGYSDEALAFLKTKKNRIILILKNAALPALQFRSLLHGIAQQNRDTAVETPKDLTPVTTKKPAEKEIADLLFANKLVKHSKSNAIVLAKDGQLLASGVGQTSRVDALKQAIAKAQTFGFSLQGAVMASDAFFPFPDCVAIAQEAGITAVVQPGGSINDEKSISYCNEHNIAMVTTGIRHFKH